MPTELEQLRTQLEAEREAHAAEVARLRTLLQEWNDLAQHQGLSTQAHRNRTAAALAAPPTAAAQAVEALRKAVHDVLKEYDTSPEGRISTWGLRTALAAWKEATNG